MEIFDNSFNQMINNELIGRYKEYTEDIYLMADYPLIEPLDDDSDESVESFFNYISNEEKKDAMSVPVNTTDMQSTDDQTATTSIESNKSLQSIEPANKRQVKSRGKDMELLRKYYQVPDDADVFMDANDSEEGVTEKLVKPADETAMDEDNRPYCWCNQPSWGFMIACDNPKCEREWFHNPCVDLPGDREMKLAIWYCSANCANAVNCANASK